MEIDRFTLSLIALVALQGIQLLQTAVLGRVVRKSLRPPPPSSRGTPVVFDEDETPSKRVRARRGRDDNENR